MKRKMSRSLRSGIIAVVVFTASLPFWNCDAYVAPKPSFVNDRRSIGLHAAPDPSEMDPLQQALYQKELEPQQSSWLHSTSSLPFECTSCGKCCRTIGNVYMSPEETTAAAEYTNKTVSEFIQSYATHTIHATDSRDEQLPYILLANADTEKGPSCIFLDQETNFCQIYPVRPIQCSTYPFWSNVLENEYNWNAEVRRTDDDLSSSLPPWTADGGGCEGMNILSPETTSSSTEGVPIAQALEQVALYDRDDRRLPRDGVVRRVGKSQ
jgi:Fe-S-cluster containining protein